MAEKRILTIERGPTFVRDFVFTNSATNGPFDLTGYQAKAEIRNQSDELVASFNCEILTPPTQGVLRVSLTSSQALGLPLESTLLYDIFLISEGRTVRPVYGNIIVTPTTTHLT